MGLVLEQIKSPGLAQLSYIVGDDSAGVAAVIDPRRDVEIYLNRARELGLATDPMPSRPISTLTLFPEPESYRPVWTSPW